MEVESPKLTARQQQILDLEQLAHHGAVAVLEDVQRGRDTGEQHRVEREQRHRRHLVNLPPVRAGGRRLGAARANSVKAALVAQGIDAGRIETGTGGEAAPADTNATATGQAGNRRTELVALSR